MILTSFTKNDDITKTKIEGEYVINDYCTCCLQIGKQNLNTEDFKIIWKGKKNAIEIAIVFGLDEGQYAFPRFSIYDGINRD